MQNIEKNPILSDAQKLLLAALSKKITNNYALGGGTALSAFYLKHRLSEDLDFFALNDKNYYGQAELEKVLGSCNLNIIEKAKISDRKIFFISIGGTIVETEFTPLYLERMKAPALIDNMIFVESLDDIIANKIIAMTDRFEPKDFIDIYFLNKEFNLSLNDMVEIAARKYKVPYEYLVKLERIIGKREEDIDTGYILKPFNYKEMISFFVVSNRELAEKTKKTFDSYDFYPPGL